MFDLAAIKRNTNLVSLEYHESLGSTNDLAFELVRQGWEYPGLILTNVQTKGRGRGANQWWANDNSLTFSWACPIKSISRIPLIPIATAVSIAEALENVTDLKNVQIKWPNDILIGNNKLSGVLIETKQTACVIGIGINVNNERLPESKSQVHSPTSIKQQLGKETCREKLLIETVNRLEQTLVDLDADKSGASSIVDRCNARLAFAGEILRIRMPNGTLISGISNCVSTKGSLLLETETGLQEIFTGTIETNSGQPFK